jgi:hypothetical protein
MRRRVFFSNASARGAASRLRFRSRQNDLRPSRLRLRLVPVMLHMLLRRFRCMVRCVVEVTLRRMRVVRRYFVIAFFVVSRRFTVMTRRVFVMFRRLAVMLCRLLRHRSSSFHC